MDPPPQAQHQDLWLAPDKLGHFILCALCTAAGFFATWHRPALRRWRVAVAAVAGTFVGVMKEVGDGLGWWPGGVSAKDLGADLVGVAAAVVALVAYEPRLLSVFGQHGAAAV